MSLNVIIELLLDDAKADLLSREPVHQMEKQSLWDDFGLEAATGLPPSLSEHLLLHVKELLAEAIFKLPSLVQQNIWLLTDQGQNYLFEIEWAWKNEPETLPGLDKKVCQYIDESVSYLCGLLLQRAEMERASEEMEDFK